MPLQIKVSDNPFQEQIITLNGNSLFITISFNTRGGSDGRWFIDLEDRSRLAVMSGVKCLTGQNLVEGNLTLKEIIAGGLYCVKTKDTGTDITRDNFGTDKEYQLWYISEVELEAL